MNNLLDALNNQINEIRKGNTRKKITIRRLHIDDQLINDELINTERKDEIEILKSRKAELLDTFLPLVKKQDFKNATIARDKASDEIKSINARINIYIESSVFMSGNLFALAQDGDVVYLSKRIVSSCLKIEL